jgi:hypothetical protein
MLSISASYFVIIFGCVSIKFEAKIIPRPCSRFHFSSFGKRHYLTHLHNSLSTQTCCRYRVEICTEHKVRVEMQVCSGVAGVATVGTVLEPCVQSLYFLDRTCMFRDGGNSRFIISNTERKK